MHLRERPLSHNFPQLPPRYASVILYISELIGRASLPRGVPRTLHVILAR